MQLTRRNFNKAAVLAGAAGLMGLPLSSAQAAEPKSYKIGQYTIFPITDVGGDQSAANFVGDEKVIAAALPKGSAPAGVQVFLIKTGGRNILIDTGVGQQLLPELAARGVKPEDISLILITHMHGDHVGGLFTKDGKRAFPKATVKIARPEHLYWEKSDIPQVKAQMETLKKVYGTSVEPFQAWPQTFAGIKAEAANGHTPGHTVFRIEAEGKTLVFVGDLLHGADLQFPHPEINSKYDMDATKSAAERLKMFEAAAKGGWMLAGAHIAAPSVVTVTKTGDKTFKYIY
jgi:glyoxylase-like metal-dependent hydrolase (beta-lactamase superfamily II)